MGEWADLLDAAIQREPMVGGWSGSGLERFVLADGRVVVAKRISPEWDVIMRVTGDDGRLHRMWRSGIFARMPAVIDHAMLAVEPEGNGWLVVMRDASDDLVLSDSVLSRVDNYRILTAMCALHEAFLEEDLSELRLRSVGDHVTRFSPIDARAYDHPLAKMIVRGWELFVELVPDDISAAVSAVHSRPEDLAAELGRCEKSLIHGDFRFANLGLHSDRIVVLDWGTLSTIAPPDVEFGYYLAICWSQIKATKDELIEDYRSLAGDRFDPRAFGLSIFLALAHLGWNKAIVNVDEPDGSKREREKEDLEWWIRRVRRELELWSPV